jgi:thiol-disulfide isomerase/thioredoxin
MPVRSKILVASAALAVFALLMSPTLPLLAQAPADPRVTDALDKGEAALKARKWEEALDAFKQAHNLANKTSAEALFGMARAYHGLAAYKNEAESCQEALKVLGPHVALEATLRNQRGMALFSLAEKNTDKVLKDAEAEFRSALALPGASAMTRYNLGVTLLRQERDPEGLEHLKAFVESGVKAAELETAKRMIENPRRARENYAPDYSLTTRGGEFLSSKEMVGKTVLLDFWGTWCGPCRAATPDLVKLFKKVAGDDFVMVGVSSDAPSDKQTWTDYIDKNKMEWPQNLDSARTVHRVFQVTKFPTYIVINAEGIIKLRLEGYGSTTVQQLEAEIKKSLKANR